MAVSKKDLEGAPEELRLALKNPATQPPWVRVADDDPWENYTPEMRKTLIYVQHPWARKRDDDRLNAALAKGKFGTREAKEIEPVDFTCPVCGGKTFTASYSDNGIIGPGYCSRISGYSCDGCSVIFGNPFLFNRRRKSRRRK